MEHKKNGSLGFNLIGGGCVSFLVFLFCTPGMALLFYLLALLAGGTIGDSAVSFIILLSPICGGILGLIALIAAPFILNRMNLPREITTPAMKGAAVIAAATFVVIWIFGAVGTHIYNLNQFKDLTFTERLPTDVIAGVLCGLPFAIFAAVIGFLVIYFRRSRKKSVENI